MASIAVMSTCEQLSSSDPETGEKLQKLFKYRYFILFLCIIGTFLEYSDRANINNAIISMVKPTISNYHSDSLLHLQVTNFTINKTNNSDQKQTNNLISNSGLISNSSLISDLPLFDWDPTTQGAILGSFFYGYIILQIPAGRLSEIFGGKWIVFVSVFFSGLINVATPYLAYSVPLLIMGRAIMGMFQGVVYPACFSLICNWMSPSEKSLSLALLYSGANLGIVFAASLTGYLSEIYGWPISFYLIGSLTLIFSLVWLIFAQSNPPTQCPRVISVTKGSTKTNENYGSCSSLDTTCSSVASSQGSKKPILEEQKMSREKIPWGAIFTNAPFLSSLVCRFGAMLVVLLLQTKLPGYLNDVLQVSSSVNGMINSIVYIGASISMTVSPLLSEFVIKNNYMSRTNTRKAFSGLGLYICVLGFITIPLINYSEVLTLLTLVLIVIGCGLTGGGDIIIPAEITRKYPATIYSIINCIVSIIGIFVPLVIGLILQSAKTNSDLKCHWNSIFNFSAIIVSITTTVFMIYGSAEVQESIDRHQSTSNIKTMNRNQDVTKLASVFQTQVNTSHGPSFAYSLKPSHLRVTLPPEFNNNWEI